MTDLKPEQFREIGFTYEARKYPLSELGFLMLCAFTGQTPERAHPAMRFYPNESTKECWERVEAAAREFLTAP